MNTSYGNDILTPDYTYLADRISVDFEELHHRWSQTLANLMRESAESILGARYDMDFSGGRRHGFRESYPEIYWDTPFGLVLLSCGEPVAWVGFTFNRKRNRITIHQVQGRWGYKNTLRPIYFEQFLFRAVIDVAAVCRVKRVWVRPAQMHMWYWRPYNACSSYERKKIRRRMRRRYNETPRRCGFASRLFYFHYLVDSS